MTESPQQSRRLLHLIAVACVVIALASTAIVTWSDGAPVATFRFGPDRDVAEPFAEVPTYDAMDLSVDMPFAGYVYVVSFDHRHGTVGYFPSDFLGTDLAGPEGRMNRLPSGRHELPGTWDGKPQAWYVPDSGEVLTLCVLVSPRELTDLEQMLTLVRQVGNKAFPSRSMGMYMPRAGRDKVIGTRKLPHEILRAAQYQEAALLSGPMVQSTVRPEVFVKVLNIRPGKPRAGAKPPDNPFAKQLRSIANGKLKSAPPNAKLKSAPANGK